MMIASSLDDPEVVAVGAAVIVPHSTCDGVPVGA